MNPKTFVKRWKAAKSGFGVMGSMILNLDMQAASPEVRILLIAEVTKSRMSDDMKARAMRDIEAGRLL